MSLIFYGNFFQKVSLKKRPCAFSPKSCSLLEKSKKTKKNVSKKVYLLFYAYIIIKCEKAIGREEIRYGRAKHTRSFFGA